MAALLLRLFVCIFAVLNIRAHSINEIKDAFKLVDINFKMHSMATKIALNECARLAVSDFIDIVVAVHLTNFRSVEMARVRAKTRDAVRLTHIRGAHCLANGECVCVYNLHVYYDDNCVSMSWMIGQSTGQPSIQFWHSQHAQNYCVHILLAKRCSPNRRAVHNTIRSKLFYFLLRLNCFLCMKNFFDVTLHFWRPVWFLWWISLSSVTA